MNNQITDSPSISEFRRSLLYALLSIIMLTAACRGVIYLGKGLPIGWLGLVLGVVMLVFIPFIQEKERRVNPNKIWPTWFLGFLLVVAAYMLFGMLNNLI